jgi:cytoskeleton protein RodZ
MEQDRSALGLTTIRRNRGVSLEQIAQTTKISVRTLQAIEVGDFKKLPGGIYNTNYIKQYAKAIDFDATALLDYYYRKMGLLPVREDSDNKGPNHTDKGAWGGFRPSTLLGS